jgi:hypothetical protein
MMAASGLQQERIAAAFGVTAKTLRRAARHELDTGADHANTAVVQALHRMATVGPPTTTKFLAARFWLKCRCPDQWREPPVSEVWRSVAEMSEAEIDARLGIESGKTFGDGRVVKFPPGR